LHFGGASEHRVWHFRNATKKEPHPEPVEGRTAEMQQNASGPISEFARGNSPM
jgi:hypothetical protein